MSVCFETGFPFLFDWHICKVMIPPCLPQNPLSVNLSSSLPTWFRFLSISNLGCESGCRSPDKAPACVPLSSHAFPGSRMRALERSVREQGSGWQSEEEMFYISRHIYTSVYTNVACFPPLFYFFFQLNERIIPCWAWGRGWEAGTL